MTTVRMVRGAVVGPGGRTAAPGERVTVEDWVAADLVSAGKAVRVDPEPAPAAPLTTVTDRELTAEHRDPASRRGRR